MKIATSYVQKDGNSYCALLIVFLILHSRTLVCQYLGFRFHFAKTGVLCFYWFLFMNYGRRGKKRNIEVENTICAWGWTSMKWILFMNTHSLLCFHPKPSFVNHDDNVISNPKIIIFVKKFKLCSICLLHFPFMLYSWSDSLHVVVDCMLCHWERLHLDVFAMVYMNHVILSSCFFAPLFQCVYF